MFVIPDVPLVPQQKDMACWYASAQMLIGWKRARLSQTLADHPDPSQVADTVRLHATNEGLQYDHVLWLAKTLGLRAVPPQSMSLGGIEGLLVRHGPLWTHGAEHIFVIAGADTDKDRIWVHDPWPPAEGAVEWRSYSRWFIWGGDPGSRGTAPAMQASFLYHP